MPTPSNLLVCVAVEGTEDLQLLEVYRRLPDASAEQRGFVRIVDDSGEDYLYPESAFLPLPSPPALERRLEGLAAESSRARTA